MIEAEKLNTYAPKPSKFMIVLMNLWAYPFLLVLMLVSVSAFLFGWVINHFWLKWQDDKYTRWAIWAYGRVWLLFMSPFVRFERQQTDLLERDKPYLFVINHLSFFDRIL